MEENTTSSVKKKDRANLSKPRDSCFQDRNGNVIFVLASKRRFDCLQFDKEALLGTNL